MAITIEVETEITGVVESSAEIYPVTPNQSTGYLFIGVKDQPIAGNTITLVDLPIP